MKKYTLRELRAFKKYTQRELAQKSDLAPMTVNRYETDLNELKKVKYGVLEDIAKALDVEVEDIDMDRI